MSWDLGVQSVVPHTLVMQDALPTGRHDAALMGVSNAKRGRRGSKCMILDFERVVKREKPLGFGSGICRGETVFL